MGGSSSPSGTTFVHVQPDNFRDLVQRLTGSNTLSQPPSAADYSRGPSPAPPPQSPPIPAPARPHVPSCTRRNAAPSRLQERKRASTKYADLAVSTNMMQHQPALHIGTASPAASASSVLPSPSTVFAGLRVSDDRLLDAFRCSELEEYEDEQEERAVREKRFYIRSSPSPSPRNMPQLLPLFPVSSTPASPAEN